MNRPEFIGQTCNGRISDDMILQYHDHVMTAYSILESLDNYSISGSTDDMHSTLKININSSNPSDILSITKHINEDLNNTVVTYGRSFHVEMVQNGDSATMFVREYNH